MGELQHYYASLGSYLWIAGVAYHVAGSSYIGKYGHKVHILIL